MYDTMMLLTKSGRQRRKRTAAARARSALYVREMQYIGLEARGGVGVEGPLAPGGQKDAPPWRLVSRFEQRPPWRVWASRGAVLRQDAAAS